VTCESVREDAAVAVLTRKPLTDEAQAHLAGCPSCQAELADLAVLPPLLASAATNIEQLEAGRPGDALLERLLAAASDERRDRRRMSRIVAVAAAVLLVLVPAGAWGWSHLRGSVAVVAAHSVDTSASDPATGVSARVQLAPARWGSTLTMSVKGVREGTRCTLVVVTSSGARQTAATWQADSSYVGPAVVSGTVAADVTSIARVDVVDDQSGRVLLHVPVNG